MPGTSAVDESGNDLNMALTDVSARKNFKNAAKTVMNSVKAAGAISESTIGVDGKLTTNNNGNRVVLLPDEVKTSKESLEHVNSGNQTNDLNRFDDVICDTDGDGNVVDDGALNGVNVAFEEVDMDKIETATADVIVNEYPIDCFPDKWYERCPWCLEETPFMLKWRELRYHSYNLVENKYFETVCITLILISSMTLVSAARFHLI